MLLQIYCCCLLLCYYYISSNRICLCCCCAFVVIFTDLIVDALNGVRCSYRRLVSSLMSAINFRSDHFNQMKPPSAYSLILTMTRHASALMLRLPQQETWWTELLLQCLNEPKGATSCRIQMTPLLLSFLCQMTPWSSDSEPNARQVIPHSWRRWISLARMMRESQHQAPIKPFPPWVIQSSHRQKTPRASLTQAASPSSSGDNFEYYQHDAITSDDNVEILLLLLWKLQSRKNKSRK